MAEKMEAPHAVTCEAVMDFYKVNLQQGLSEAQVQEQRQRYGLNQLDEQEKKSLWELIIAQFEDLLVRILLLSALVSFFLAYFDEKSAEEGLTAYVEPLVILAILVANAFVGVWQESNAEKALDALKKLQPDTATVLRDGHWSAIEANLVVPGDIVEVKVGDKVPADMRVVKLKTTTIRIEQSQLTGESMSVSKEVEPVTSKECVIQSKTNMLFSSTTVSNGACIGCVTGTGMSTEIGVIQSAVKQAATEEEQTPLQQKLDDFGELLAKVIFIICALVWIINYKHFFDPIHGTFLRGCIYYFKIAVALAVAAIPEGLPAVITTCLALGTRKMAKRNAIVRKLPSVETLGCTTVICSDKTGTLTTNEMCCKQVALPVSATKMQSFQVEGHTYAPIGKVIDLDADWDKNKGLHVFSKVAAICNESRLDVDIDGRFKRSGEPTEAALRVLVEKIGCPDVNINTKCLQAEKRTKEDAMAFSNYWMNGVRKLAVLEFTRDRKSMSVLCGDKNQQGNVLYVKGAPESILERCTTILLPDGKTEPLTEQSRKAVQAKMLDMARGALRTLALAVRTDLTDLSLHDYTGDSHPGHAQLSDPANFVKVEQSLTFVGMVGIIDPPRPECKQAIEECRIAGISVIMITGDNKVTAEAIAMNLGILNNSDNLARKSFTGKEFEELSEADKAKVLERIMQERDVEGAVFSRTEPKHKQIIIKILKSFGEIAAMTGDGVNDAPALKQADIGIAMGITGTEVAKEASDMVLADDNFSTIVSAVEEGRSIYSNMKAFIRYLISSNIGEVASIFFTAAMGIPEGLAPVQLLWVNLVTDGLPATALGFNPPDLSVMQKPPRRKDDALISGWVFFRYMVIGMYVGIATVGIFVYWYSFDTGAPDEHTLVEFTKLMTWNKCPTWEGFKPKDILDLSFEKDPCSYFTAGKIKASTLSLTTLVVIEMLNALNALSEDGSLVQMPPWTNPWLILACLGSMVVHFVIVYIPFLAKIFAVCSLDWHDWVLVMAFSFPVILIDEVLKFFGRQKLKRLKAKAAARKRN
uniref:P-type Ca(2+) transporter n=1 Tax=Alexandrium monilatum TaxID=311494 RepID=A0A7S4S3Y9_9DINO|mmetsp:Transcript_24712/g.73761  ORF Transcript_24712/g.73761 Transcript_24712/m.73761 type:complete len:1040 (-) Transcript_24712:290-3409(-)